MDTEITTGKLLLVEYEHLKDEQKTRIGFRDNLLYAALGAMAAVIAVTLQSNAHANLLLLLPPVSVLLGWTYLVNDDKVSAIGRYIRTELAPRLAILNSEEAPVFGWETAHRTDQRRISRKLLQIAVDLVTFCLSPLAAIVVFWISGPLDAPFVMVSLVELLAVVVLAIQITIYAELRP